MQSNGFITHVRLPCTITHRDKVAAGTCLHLSHDRLYLRASACSIQPGSSVDVMLRLPKREDPIMVRAEIVWRNDQELKAESSATFLAEIPSHDADATKHLETFIGTFQPAIIVVDDEIRNLNALRRLFEDDYRIILCARPQEALEALDREAIAVLITDQMMPDMTGTELLSEVAHRFQDIHTVRIVLSAHTDLSTLQEFVNRCHIAHFLPKPFDLRELRRVISQAMESYALAANHERLTIDLAVSNQLLRKENAVLKRKAPLHAGFDEIVGQSEALRQALEKFELVRQSDVTLHLQGETGTGKELIARALHDGGPRAAEPFVVQNCAGLTDSLLQSTLFGHKRGAFTGADRDRLGVFQEANGGTLFLDEVAELSPQVQGALLRAIQEGEIVPVGDSRPQKVDVRIVSATHKDLRAEVASGRFREDLYFRLVVVAIRLPPLRERQGDVPILIEHFLRLYQARHSKSLLGLSDEVTNVFLRYRWPGNIRELANEIERLVVLANNGDLSGVELLSEHIQRETLPSAKRESMSPKGIVIPFDLSYDESIKKLSRALIERALDRARGIIRDAAELLQMERSRLAKLRRRMGVGLPNASPPT